MANKRIIELNNAPEVNADMYAAMDSEEGGTVRVDYNKLAKALIEQYAQSQLAGENQSVKAAFGQLDSAISELNSKTADIVRYVAQWDFTIPANSQLNTSSKPIIDAATPSGYEVIGIIGFTTNDTTVVPISVRYAPSNYSFQIKNTSNSQRTSRLDVYVIAGKIPVRVIN